MFESLKRMLTRGARKSQTLRFFMRTLNVDPVFKQNDFAEFTQEAFEKNPYVYAAITQTANSCASIPPILYRVKNRGEIERALGEFNRKRAHGRRQKRRKREAAKNVRQTRTRAIQSRYAVSEPVARRIATKAMVESGELEVIEGHELLDLLHHPNEWYQRSYQQLIQAFVQHLEIGGMSLTEPLGPDSGPPQEIYALPPKNVEFIRGTEQSPIRGFGVEGRRTILNYDPDPSETDVFYHRYYNPLNPLLPLPPTLAARWSISINNEGRRWNLSLLQNGAQLSGVISAKGPISDTQVESVKEQFGRQYGGAKNAGRIAMLEDVEGLDFTPMSQTVQEMAWMDLNRITALEASIVWGIPPEILGDQQSKTYSNYKEARKAFYLEKITPLMDFIYGEFNASFVPLYGDDLLLDYDTSGVDALNDDVDALHERARQDFKEGLLDLNEARQMIGYDEKDGGDVIFISMNKVPLQMAAGGATVESSGDSDAFATPPENGELPDAEGEDGDDENGDRTARERALRSARGDGSRFFPELDT